MKALHSQLRAFGRDEKGSIAIETVLIIPALFWAYLAMFAIFDAYRNYSINQKAAYTLGDLVSRETTPIDPTYMNGLRSMLSYLTNENDMSKVSLRVTSVKYDEDGDAFEVQWSETRGSAATPLTSQDVAGWDDRLPVMADNDFVTVVETWVNYDPPFNTGLAVRDIRNFVFTRPRYAPEVLFNDDSS